MSLKATSRMRDLLHELQRTQTEAGGLARQARQDVAGAINGADLRPASASDRTTRKKKAGKKKR